ncbi:MAG: hypothetical protein ACKOJF_12070, partial [Planctomycetaceae bacterium]
MARSKWCPAILWLLGLACAWLPTSPVAAADPLAAERLFQTGQYEQCLEQVATALEEKNPLERWRLLKLRCELELGRYPAALATYEAALKQFPQGLELRWLGR